MKNNKLSFNLKWWKFDKYEWQNHPSLGPIIRPSKDAKYSEYNPWEANEKKKISSIYKLPMYGSLLAEIDARKYEELLRDINFYSKDRVDKRAMGDDVQPLEELQAEKIRLEAHIKRQILSFVEEYGLLGIFFNIANKYVSPARWIPVFQFKEIDFSNDKKNGFFSTEIYKMYNELDRDKIYYEPEVFGNLLEEQIGLTYHDVLLNFHENGTLPNELYLETVLPISSIDFFDGAEWKRTDVKANLNQKGMKFFEGKSYNELIQLNKKYNGFIEDEYLEKNSHQGIYYNVIPPSLEQQWNLEGKRPYYEITNWAPLEFFIPLAYQSHYFLYRNDDFILPSVLSAHVNNPIKIWDIGEKFYNMRKDPQNYSDYFETLTDIIVFISSLQEASDMENYKKSIADGAIKFKQDEILGNLSDAINLNSNIFLNKFISRNYNRTDFSNTENPISFRSPSLAGIISEMFLRDNLDGKQYRQCANEKCSRWSIMKDNQKYCSLPRRCAPNQQYKNRTVIAKK